MDAPHAVPAAEPCDYLEWDSAFFGVRIGRVRSERLTDELSGQVVRWAARHGVDCLYFFGEPADRATILAAERAGFSLVDWRVTYAVDPRGRPPGRGDRAAIIRPAADADVPALRAIARESHTDTRFYFDGKFPRERCDRLYETWIEQSCRGAAQLVLAAEMDGGACGYVTCHLDDDGGRIGLVGLHPRARGRGIGRAAIDAALDWFAGRNVPRVSVVTQGRNLAAARLYERCGFTISSATVVYHWWSKQLPR